MKRTIKILALWGFVIAVITAGLGFVFRDQLEKGARRYLKRQTKESILRYGSELPAVDEVRLLHIEEKSSGPSLGTYRVPFSETPNMFIVSDRTLTGDDAQEVATLWRALKLHNDYMAGCYAPHHVVQFRAKGATICEAVICFMCGNTTLPAFPIRTMVSFEGIPHKESEAYLKFRATIERFVGAHPKPPLIPKTAQ